MADGRRLAAIVAADVAGYSRLVGVDEEGTIHAPRSRREAIIEPRLADHGGRIANTAGDSFLIEFPSAVEAVRCVMEIQAEFATANSGLPEDRQLWLRVGVNVGDIVAQGDDMLGDGVNVAARLEGIADPGGICISRSARDQVRDRLDIWLEDMGEVSVKNIARPVRAFRIAGTGRVPRTSRVPGKAGRLAVVLAVVCAVIGGGGYWWYQTGDMFDRGAQSGDVSRSVAVLPLVNLSPDRTQTYFADGISEDISVGLAKVAGLNVTPRSATLRFRGQDPAVIGKALGVGYILDGTLRRAENRIRITAKLLNARTGKQIWAERFDREARDVFAIQDEIAGRVIAALSRRLGDPNLKSVKRRHTPKLEAYDSYVQGRGKMLPPTPGNLAASRAMFEKAIDLDARFAGGYAGAAFTYVLEYEHAPIEQSVASGLLDRATSLARRAVELDPGFGPGWGSLAEVQVRQRKFDAGIASIQKAIEAAPNDALLRVAHGKFLGFVGRPAEGIQVVKQAMRMSPDSLPMLFFLGSNYRVAGEYEKAIEALVEHRKRLGGRVIPGPTAQLIAAYSQSGRQDKAREEARRLAEAAPYFTTVLAGRISVYKDDAAQQSYLAALRDAGVPDKGPVRQMPNRINEK